MNNNKSVGKINKDNFFDYFRCKTFSILQIVSIVCSAIGSFGFVMLMWVRQLVNSNSPVNIIYIDIFSTLAFLFVLGLLCTIIFTIIKDKRKQHAYEWFKENRNEVETEENIRNNLKIYTSMVKDYATVYGLFTVKKNGKVKSSYNMLTILYGFMIAIDLIIIFYLDFFYISQNGINSIGELLIMFVPTILLSIYIAIFIGRIYKQKTYYVKGSAYYQNDHIEIDCDEIFLDFIQDNQSLHKYVDRIGKKKSWFTYIFAFLSSAILVGLPMIFILVVVFILYWIIGVILSMLNVNIGSSYSSGSDSNYQENNQAENIHGYDGQGVIVLKDVNLYRAVIKNDSTLVDTDTGIEYRIYNYHSNSGYFEDENGNVYYHCMNDEIKYSGDYRHYGESEYEADNRIHNSVGFTR